MSLEVSNMREFLSQLDTYVAVSSKPCAEALNKKALDLAYRAAERTPKLTATSIRSDLRRDPHLLAALTSLHLRGTKLKSPQFKEEMKSLENARANSARYLRSGWAPCIEQLGGRYDRNTKGGRGGATKKLIRSYAEKATDLNPVAQVIWVTDQDNERKQAGAEAIAGKALEGAVEFVMQDMEAYISKKLAEVWA